MKRIALLFVLANIAAAQKAPNLQAETSGTCSPVIQGNQGKVEFTCDAMDAATISKIERLLNAILKNAKDTNATNKKLDEILEYLTHFQALKVQQKAFETLQPTKFEAPDSSTRFRAVPKRTVEFLCKQSPERTTPLDESCSLAALFASVSQRKLSSSSA